MHVKLFQNLPIILGQVVGTTQLTYLFPGKERNDVCLLTYLPAMILESLWIVGHVVEDMLS
jgi:hypothetical protein